MKLNAVLGQPHAVELLTRAIASGGVSGGFLFHGPPGTGKRTAALGFARALICEAPKGPGDCCETCRPCVEFEKGIYNDFQTVGPDEEAGGRDRSFKLETLRAAMTWASRSSRGTSHKVCLLEDAHLMGREAANAFLKMLEEPPARTVWVLLAPAATAVLPTIRSRCRLVRFTLLSREAVEGILRLQGHAEAEEAAALCLGRLDEPLETIQASMKEAEVYLELARRVDLAALASAAQSLARKDALEDLSRLLDGLERVLAARLRLKPEEADRWIAALDAVARARWRYRGALTKTLTDGLGAELATALQP
jgi:DNA polymerase-3 subunit delta'